MSKAEDAEEAPPDSPARERGGDERRPLLLTRADVNELYDVLEVLLSALAVNNTSNPPKLAAILRRRRP